MLAANLKISSSAHNHITAGCSAAGWISRGNTKTRQKQDEATIIIIERGRGLATFGTHVHVYNNCIQWIHMGTINVYRELQGHTTVYRVGYINDLSKFIEMKVHI